MFCWKMWAPRDWCGIGDGFAAAAATRFDTYIYTLFYLYSHLLYILPPSASNLSIRRRIAPYHARMWNVSLLEFSVIRLSAVVMYIYSEDICRAAAYPCRHIYRQIQDFTEHWQIKKKKKSTTTPFIDKIWFGLSKRGEKRNATRAEIFLENI